MHAHEPNLIKILAALTAAPRWVTALVIADGARFAWGNEPWWIIGSACLSVLFAGVETYAASYIMRAWRSTKAGSDAERILLLLWLIILAVLVCIMAPPIYANTVKIAFSELPGWLIIPWSVSVAASTFLVIGGVGYAERQVAPMLPEIAPEELPVVLPQVQLSLPEPKTWRQLSTTERAEVLELSVSEIMERYHVSERTARNWRAH